jgi:hypothetical protein
MFAEMPLDNRTVNIFAAVATTLALFGPASPTAKRLNVSSLLVVL